MILEVFIFCELIELGPEVIEGHLVLHILWGLILLLLPLPQIVLQQLLQSSKENDIVMHRLTVHHRAGLYLIPDYYRESLL